MRPTGTRKPAKEPNGSPSHLIARWRLSAQANEPSPGADAAGVSPVPAQMWACLDELGHDPHHRSTERVAVVLHTSATARRGVPPERDSHLSCEDKARRLRRDANHGRIRQRSCGCRRGAVLSRPELPLQVCSPRRSREPRSTSCRPFPDAHTHAHSSARLRASTHAYARTQTHAGGRMLCRDRWIARWIDGLMVTWKDGYIDR
jgi:hypothetical protein